MFEAELLVSEINKLAAILSICMDALCIAKAAGAWNLTRQQLLSSPFLNLELESPRRPIRPCGGVNAGGHLSPAFL